MSCGKDKGNVTPEEEKERVKNLIKQCMAHNLNQMEVIDVLYEQEKIERSFTETIWQELEKQNQELFENYYSRLNMKEMRSKQAEMMNQSNIPPINFDRGASSSLLEKIPSRRTEEMQMVKNLIEQCLMHYMSQEQVMDVLYQKENIEPYFTKTVWRHLEEQNEEFFKNYNLRLAVKHTTLKFNNLVERQAAIMNQSYPPNEVAAMVSQKFDVRATPTEVEIDRHRLGTLGLQLQAPPTPTPAVHLR